MTGPVEWTSMSPTYSNFQRFLNSCNISLMTRCSAVRGTHGRRTDPGGPTPGSLPGFSALLVDDDGRMTAAELTSSLGSAPASISGAVRYLEQVGMVRRERERGSRRDVYVVDDDAWHGAMMRTDQVYAPMIAAL